MSRFVKLSHTANRLTRSPRAVVATTLGVAALASAAVLTPASAAVTAQATNVTVASTGPGEATVSWAATDTGGLREWQVVLSVSDQDGSSSRWLFAPPAARSMVVDNLPTGASIYAGVAVFTGSSTVNWSATTPTITVASGLCTGVSGGCVSADGTAPLGPEQHVAQGFLHGLNLTSTGVSEMAALAPRWWRISEPTQSEWTSVLTNFPSASITAILSDAWFYYTYNSSTGTAESPWEDWTKYQDFIVSQVNQRIADGQVPAYWDIQNEPDVPGYYDPSYPPTTALLEQQYQTAYDAITSVLPNAQVIGPTLSSDRLVGDSTYLGLQDFIDWATANNLPFAAVTWHEINAGNGSSAANNLQLPGLTDRVQGIRTELDESPVLANTKIFINEYDSAPTTQLVGWDLGHVVALEQAGVDQANRSCFAGCGSNDVADELLASDGQTPRMTYWGRKVYAGMSGQRMLATSTAHDTTLLAANGGSATSMTVLVTRHHGCSVPSNLTACPTGSFQAPVSSGPLTALLRMPPLPAGQTASKATLTVTQLSNSTSNQPGMPAPSLNTTVRVGSSGVVRTNLSSLPDGAAYVIQVAWVLG